MVTPCKCITNNSGDSNSVTVAPGEATKLRRRVDFYRTQASEVYALTVVVQGLGNFTMSTLLGTDAPLLVTPVSQTASSISIIVDNSGYAFNGQVNISVVSPVQAYGQV
jgi:uncharacterized protein YfaP (DUF2135 family)